MPVTPALEAGKLEIQGHSLLYREFKAIQGHMSQKINNIKRSPVSGLQNSISYNGIERLEDGKKLK